MEGSRDEVPGFSFVVVLPLLNTSLLLLSQSLLLLGSTTSGTSPNRLSDPGALRGGAPCLVAIVDSDFRSCEK